MSSRYYYNNCSVPGHIPEQICDGDIPGIYCSTRVPQSTRYYVQYYVSYSSEEYRGTGTIDGDDCNMPKMTMMMVVVMMGQEAAAAPAWTGRVVGVRAQRNSFETPIIFVEKKPFISGYYFQMYFAAAGWPPQRWHRGMYYYYNLTLKILSLLL